MDYGLSGRRRREGRSVTGRHYAAQTRVQQFVKAWKRAFPNRGTVTNGFGIYDLQLVDLEELMKPRQVVRTLPELQALPVGTKLIVQGDRAAQIEHREAWDYDTGAESKRLLYVGTELDDVILPTPDRDTLDTLRRMLPATVIDTKED